MPSVPAELLSLIPPSLHSIVENHWSDWIASCEAKNINLDSDLPLPQLGKTWACSDFVARNCIRYPAMFVDLLSESMGSPRSIESYRSLLVSIVSTSQDESQLMTALRELRQQEMVRIAWRDLNSLAGVDVILQELTDLAEAFVSVVLQHLEQQLAEKFGMPLDAEGDEQALLVFAMGKMGGGELNFSSDIDLIFTFAEDGETTGRRKTSHYEFYLAVIRKLVKMLDEITVDGFVYRVDTRLRPFGKSGSLAMSFSGLEQYYQLQGRDWERYAMIKAKLITGREADKKYLQSMLTPFVYRRYLDFSMIESIREMKSMINAQMKRKGMTNNIKLGHGGIREIEFIGQTLQLIRAGREPELRERSIIKLLALLAEKNYLTEKEACGLTAAYWFLRKLENRLQMLGDKQTHVLPEDDIAQQQITLAMGFVDWAELVQDLAVHQQVVDAVFQNLITTQSDDQSDDKAAEISVFALFWSDAEKHIENDDEAYRNLQHYLQSLGYQQTDELIEVLNDLHASSAIKNLNGDSARLMAHLMESLIEKIADYPAQLILFERVIKILKALAGRKVYISLLNEYPAIQLQMLTLSSASEWFTERLTRYPILLDSLLSTAEAFRRQYDIRHLLELELQRIASDNVDDNLAEEDLELLMERMRQFKRQTVFTIAMLDVFYDEPVEKVSDQLTNLANTLLEKILEYSWQAMVLKYGEPRYVVEGEAITASMGIVAYGKMGGNELGYGSDLDIIFVHDSQGTSQATSGPLAEQVAGQTTGQQAPGDRSIDNQQFFARVAQRVIHFLNVRTYSGILYEADTRLRPDGQSGLMVSSMAAFERYQREKAWTWEHQALIRARFITSNVSGGLKVELQGESQNESQRRPQLEQDFDRIRSSVIQQPREQETLLQEVVKMREKMREHLAGNTILFDIKQDRGGLVDIEFMTQAGVLLHAEKCADCIKHTATLELINELQKVGFYTQQDAAQLSQAYRIFRKLKNWQNLQCAISAIATEDAIKTHRDNVALIWHRLMPEQENL